MNGVDLLVRVGLAVLLGVGIGIERQWRSRLTGLQTMALVSAGKLTEVYGLLGADPVPGLVPIGSPQE